MNSKGTENGGARRNSGPKVKKGGVPFKVIEGQEAAAEQARKRSAPDWMRRQQVNGRAELMAEEIQQKIDAWLIERGVRGFVPDHLIQMYCMALGRYIQTEEEISKTGFLAAHPTTGAPMASPYVTMSIEFAKQVQANWWQIYTTIKECTQAQGEQVQLQQPTNSLMDLLAQKKKNA